MNKPRKSTFLTAPIDENFYIDFREPPMTTTHPMIERLAQAMIADRNLPPGCSINWPRVHADVIAVLRTLREPDEGMVRQGVKKMFQPGQTFEKCTGDVIAAAIDSLLAEEKGTET